MLASLLRFADNLLIEFRPYRWAVGGKYERWMMEGPCASFHYRVREWSDGDCTGRPSICCRGTPRREERPVRRYTRLFQHHDNDLGRFKLALLGQPWV